MYIVDDVLKTALFFCAIFTVLLQDNEFMSFTQGVHCKICSVLKWEANSQLCICREGNARINDLIGLDNIYSSFKG